MKNTRQLFINIHLIIASLFLPLMLLMPLTGSLYIWGYSGAIEKAEAFRISDSLPEGEKAQEDFFREQFKKNNVDYEFEYIRFGKNDFTFRPTTRVHYSAVREEGGVVMYKMAPTLLKRLSELHKGHGPRLMRSFEAIFGIALILVAISGLWLAFTVKTYRRTTLVSFAVGTAVILFCLI